MIFLSFSFDSFSSLSYALLSQTKKDHSDPCQYIPSWFQPTIAIFRFHAVLCFSEVPKFITGWQGSSLSPPRLRDPVYPAYDTNRNQNKTSSDPLSMRRLMLPILPIHQVQGQSDRSVKMCPETLSSNCRNVRCWRPWPGKEKVESIQEQALVSFGRDQVFEF